MRVPDDVTLLSPTTIGAISAACPSPAPTGPAATEFYYHFDYVGGPRNYKWLNTNQIERTWEQMHLAYEHGARPAVDRQCRRHQADGVPDQLLPRLCLEPGGMAARAARRLSPHLGGAPVRRHPCRRDRRDRHKLQPAPPRAASRSCLARRPTASSISTKSTGSRANGACSRNAPS